MDLSWGLVPPCVGSGPGVCGDAGGSLVDLSWDLVPPFVGSGPGVCRHCGWLLALHKEYLLECCCMLGGAITWAYIIGTACGVLTNFDPYQVLIGSQAVGASAFVITGSAVS